MNLLGAIKITPTDIGAPNISIQSGIGTIVNLLLWGAGIATVGTIIYSGFLFVTSSGDPKKYELAKNGIVYALIGAVITSLSWSIVRFILAKA